MKPSTEQSNPSLKTSLPWDLNGSVVQLLPAETPKKSYEQTITTSSAVNFTLQSGTSLVTLNPKDNGVWWKWGSGCAGTTDNMHGFANAEQPMHLVVPNGKTVISVIARSGNSELTLTEY